MTILYDVSIKWCSWFSLCCTQERYLVKRRDNFTIPYASQQTAVCVYRPRGLIIHELRAVVSVYVMRVAETVIIMTWVGLECGTEAYNGPIVPAPNDEDGDRCVWNIGRMTSSRGNQNILKHTSPNSTRTVLWLNPGLRGQKSASNRLNCGTT